MYTILKDSHRFVFQVGDDRIILIRLKPYRRATVIAWQQLPLAGKRAFTDWYRIFVNFHNACFQPIAVIGTAGIAPELALVPINLGAKLYTIEFWETNHRFSDCTRV